jgi:hypothetical protein
VPTIEIKISFSNKVTKVKINTDFGSNLKVSRSLLESKSCSVQQDNKLWQEVNLKPDPFR